MASWKVNGFRGYRLGSSSSIREHAKDSFGVAFFVCGGSACLDSLRAIYVIRGGFQLVERIFGACCIWDSVGRNSSLTVGKLRGVYSLRCELVILR